VTDREHAVSALTEMIRSNNQKALQNSDLLDWFKKLNLDLIKAIETLKQGA